MRKLIVIPRKNLYIRKDTGTIAIRGGGGRFRGRRGPNSTPTKSNPFLKPYHGPGDTTRAQHLPRDMDLDGDRKIEPFEKGGTIHGRDERLPVRIQSRGITIPVRGSSKSRGTIRRNIM